MFSYDSERDYLASSQGQTHVMQRLPLTGFPELSWEHESEAEWLAAIEETRVIESTLKSEAKPAERSTP